MITYWMLGYQAGRMAPADLTSFAPAIDGLVTQMKAGSTAAEDSYWAFWEGYDFGRYDENPLVEHMPTRHYLLPAEV